MAERFEHNGQAFWVTVTAAIKPETNEGAYVAFVRDEEPDGLLYGKQVTKPDGKPFFFDDINTALIYAQDIKQSEIDGDINGFF